MSNTTKSLDSISPGKRYEIIDIIRGFALFGVLLSNMIWVTQDFSLTYQQKDLFALVEFNTWTDWFKLTFIEFKFYTLFSILFGLGFALQFIRAEEKGKSLFPTYSRRLIILFMFGIIHAVFLWFGDILHIYALLGFVLIPFSKASNKALIRWIIGIAILASLLPFIEWLSSMGNQKLESITSFTSDKSYRYKSLSSNNFLDAVKLNWYWNLDEYTKLYFGAGSVFQWYLNVFWKFLFGFYIGRKMILQKAHEHLILFKRILPWALIIGLSGCLIWSGTLVLYDIWLPDSSSPLSISSVYLEFSVLALSVAYACILVLLYYKKTSRKWVLYLAPVGRMALTNYLFHSVSFVIIFYGVGFGLLGKVGSLFCLVASLIIFVLQIIFSKWWLKKYRYGPVEWLWRSLTHGKLQTQTRNSKD